MKIGYSHIQKIIYEQSALAGVNVPGGRAKFAKDTAKKIYEMIERSDPEMSKKDWDTIHNFPPNLAKVVRQLERGLGLRLMPRDEQSKEVYQWVDEQGEEKTKVFIKWAIEGERVQYVGKYKNSPEAIKRDWMQAFKNQQTITTNKDGSINV